ncbi:MAG TPA: ABC transporter ATP-binding protein [Candidatus Saccharimonadales bacterium]|nr:ABC transporter ATP-binding protein [Candidatus Saccharimonadales bacterium]
MRSIAKNYYENTLQAMQIRRYTNYVMSAPLIHLEDVSKLYGFGDATTIALDDVSLDIAAGEFVGVMGPSGSGKSTLMNIIGLLDRPTNGEYVLRRRSVAKLRSSQRARARRDTVGFIFQSSNLLPRLNVLDNVALPLVYKGVSLSRRLRLASNMLERVGLQDREFYYPAQLSGGQAQSVAIARALVNEPDIIIADEPTGNLDSASSRLVMELLGEVHKTGNTILFVTHNPELTRYATRVVYMRDGSIIHDEQTTLGEVAATAHKVMYSIPTTTEEDDLKGVSALMEALPNMSAASKTRNTKAPRTKSKVSKRAAKSTGSGARHV